MAVPEGAFTGFFGNHVWFSKGQDTSGRQHAPLASMLLLGQACCPCKQTVLLTNLSHRPLHKRSCTFLYTQLDACESWEDTIDAVLLEFEKVHKRRATYTICYY